jgi:4-amino-4-deoxy-L-arabinose transferase-like glycosyltransferase
MTAPILPEPAQRNGQLTRLLLLLILALSAFIQFTVISRTTVVVPLRVDASDYFSYAYNLRHYGVYSISSDWAVDRAALGRDERPAAGLPTPDAYRPPGYPLFLSMLGMPEPSNAYLRRVYLVQAGLGVLSVWLLYLVAAAFLGRGWALAPALLAAISPHLAVISAHVLSESLFYFLLLAALATSLRAATNGNRWQCVAAGVLWGLCSLVRSTTQFLPPLLVLMVFALPRLRQYRLIASLGVICFLATLAPWILRNLQDSISNSGDSLMVKSMAHGSYPDFMYEGRRRSYGYPYRFDPDSEKISRNLPTILGHIAKRFGSEPVRYARWYLIGKPIAFLSWGDPQGQDILIYPVAHTPYYEDIRFATIRQVAFLLHWPLMLLGLIAVALLWLKSGWLRLDATTLRAARLVALVVVYVLALHMIAAPFSRYGIPFRPLLYALAMLPLRGAWLRLRHPE